MSRRNRLSCAAFVLPLLAVSFTASPASAGQDSATKFDAALNERAGTGGRSRVIVRHRPGASLEDALKGIDIKVGRKLRLINGQVLDVPNASLRWLADRPEIESLHLDRETRALLDRTSATVRAADVHRELGLTGAGIGVAVIDSGVTTWHDDLTVGGTPSAFPYGNQRVAHFVDFVQGRPDPYDDYGHGTHVAGIVGGNGYDSSGSRTGIAPDAHVISLKVLNGEGTGYVSDVIAALDYVVTIKDQFNIRVVNLSVGAGVYESYRTDPLTLAAKRAVESGLVVVAAAGNLGKNAAGEPQYGGITAPGNAPWVLTVGASSHQGTIGRDDDVVASWSSRGPTYIDYGAKPDLVAPGTGTASLSDPVSLLYGANPGFLLPGTVGTSYLPYLSLSGTSMAAPVVSGTVALMLQANPSLTPNAVKALLQYTAQSLPDADYLTQGAGLVDSRAAVELARFFETAEPGEMYPTGPTWTHNIIWGNYRVWGGVLTPDANAWATNVVWGTMRLTGQNVVWGTLCASPTCDNEVWRANVVWGTTGKDNVVWGTRGAGNVVWGTAGKDNVVWGTRGAGNVVWGTAGKDNVVWGTRGVDNVVWGTGQADNVVWGR